MHNNPVLEPDRLSWRCPLMPKKSLSQGLITIFDNNLWIIIGISFIILTLTVFIFLLINGKFMFGYTLLQIMVIHLGIGLMPCKGPEEALLVWLSVYGFILATAYQDGIVSALTSEIPAYKPKTLREVIDRGELGFGIFNASRRLFVKDPDDDYQYIMKNAIVCTKECLKPGLIPRKFCVLSTKKYVDYMAPALFLDGNGNKIYHEIKRNVVFSFYPEIFMQKNHILKKPFDYFMGRLCAGGFI